MNYDKAYSYLTEKLQNELNESITYHNINHTKKVIEASTIIAGTENITDNDSITLKTAALFHDAGFLISSTDHETHSCNLARKYLPQFQYDATQTAIICDLIMATKMPQSPYNLLSKVLCDADLYYLGQDDYASQAENLYLELLANKKIGSKSEWLKVQINFISSHSYFTNTANENCNPGKALNLNSLISKYNQIA